MNDVIIFGVGHSGTSLLTRMVQTLGWNVNDADEAFAESIGLRAANRRLLTKGWTVDWETSARDILQSFARPFAIKDPRLVETLPHWIPVFSRLRWSPMLLMIERSRDDLVRSYVERREIVRGQPGTRNRTLDELLELAAQNYSRWPYAKMAIRYEKVVEAASLVRTNRAMRTVGGLWLDEE